MASHNHPWALGLAVLCGAFLTACGLPIDDSTPRDREPLPSPPMLAESARPTLVESGPLTEATDNPAKPVVVADHEQRVVVVAQQVAERDLSKSRTVEWRSTDRGRSWLPPQVVENWPPKTQLMGDPSLQSDRRGRLFLVHTCRPEWSLGFRRSADAGQTWSTPIKVADGADRPVLGISPDGKRLVIAAAISERTADFPREPLNGNDPLLREKIKAGTRHSLGIFESGDRGRSWSRLPGPLGSAQAIPFAIVTDDAGRVACGCVVDGKGSRSVAFTTTDRGKTWDETELVKNLQPDRDHPFSGERFPVLALDGEGGLQVAFVGALAKELFVRRSHDWQRWSDPITLSSDPIDEVRMPAIASWGPLVHVTWLERRKGHWQVYYRGAKDHGHNWSDKLLLSVPHINTELITNAGYARQSDDDQSSITDDGTGTAHAVWSVMSAHPSAVPGRVWHAIIEWRSTGPR